MSVVCDRKKRSETEMGTKHKCFICDQLGIPLGSQCRPHQPRAGEYWNEEWRNSQMTMLSLKKAPSPTSRICCRHFKAHVHSNKLVLELDDADVTVESLRVNAMNRRPITRRTRRKKKRKLQKVTFWRRISAVSRLVLFE